MSDKSPSRSSPSPDCGACNLCCKLLAVPDIGKPARMLCWHTGLHGGCAVHDQKSTDPSLKACEQFRCVWLASQELPPDDRWAREFRPDQCGVVFGPPDRDDPKLLYVQVDSDRADSWLDPQIQEHMKQVVSRGGRIEILIGEDIRFPFTPPKIPDVYQTVEPLKPPKPLKPSKE